MNTKMHLLKMALAVVVTGGVSPVAMGGEKPNATSRESTEFPSELVDFLPYGQQPVFAGTGRDTWDNTIRERGYILRESGQYHMWYTGYNENRSATRYLGYATSPDGIHWTRYPGNPIFTNSWVEDMCVVKHDGTYTMFAEGRHDIAHLLTSTDRIHWREQGPLDIRQVNGQPISPGPYGTPTIWIEDGTWYLFYERNDLGIWLATSRDRKVWTNVQDDPVIAMGPEAYDRHAVAMNQIIKYKGRYYGYYHASAHQPWRDWTTDVAVSEDLIHWKKYSGNPIVANNQSSGILVHDGHRYRLYTMHPAVRLFFPNKFPYDAEKEKQSRPLQWQDARALELEGKGWTDTQSFFDRLPAKAKATVRSAVWNLSKDSAGMALRFLTDATEIHARWTLTSANLAMPHMAATGVSGVDLYVKTGSGRWHWLAVGKPTKQKNQVRLVAGIPEGERQYMLYLPLYNGVRSVEIGVPAGCHLAKAPPRDPGHRKPIVFYGTSITQGGCASRTGMVHTAILGRWLDRPVINLGFSGNGRMEIEVARLLAELDAAVFVIDCLPNIDAKAVSERTQPLVRTIRRSRPETPILLVEDRNYADSFLVTAKRQRNETSQAALREVFRKLKAAGDDQLYYLPGAGLLGDDGEGTVDSSHPTDLGFMRQATALREILERILAP